MAFEQPTSTIMRPKAESRAVETEAVQLLPGEINAHASSMFKALADPTRLKLLYLVAERGNNDICSHELSTAVHVSAPTVTHHMKKLAGVDLVRREQRGRWAHYSINPAQFNRIHHLITGFDR